MPKKNDSPGAQIAQDIIEKYQPKTVADMQSALKEIFGPMFQAMLNGELQAHFGYSANECSDKPSTNQYRGAVGVWERNFKHVQQLYSYGSAVRRVMYTTNAIEGVNSSFQKVIKKGAFANVSALLKLLYLRVQELYKKWSYRPIANWAMVHKFNSEGDYVEKFPWVLLHDCVKRKRCFYFSNCASREKYIQKSVWANYGK